MISPFDFARKQKDVVYRTFAKVVLAGIRETRSMKKNAPPKLQRFPAAKQRRMNGLLDKNAEGPITAREKALLEQLVEEAEKLMVANARRLAEFSKNNAGSAPPGAVPVTVWVQPQRAEQ